MEDNGPWFKSGCLKDSQYSYTIIIKTLNWEQIGVLLAKKLLLTTAV